VLVPLVHYFSRSFYLADMRLLLLLSSLAFGIAKAGPQLLPRQSSCCPLGNDFVGDIALACQDKYDTVNYGDGQCYQDWEISCGSSWAVGNILAYKVVDDPLSVGECFSYCQSNAPNAYALTFFTGSGFAYGSQTTENQCQCLNLQTGFTPFDTYDVGFAAMYVSVLPQ
jgi:hypothetical protein